MANEVGASGRGGGSGAIALVLALAALGIAGYVGYRDWTEARAAAGAAAQLVDIEGAQAGLADSVAAIERDLGRREADAAARLGTVEHDLTRLAAQVAGQAPDERLWHLAELGYLLRMADHRARLGHDATGAIVHLDAAKSLTRAFGDPSLAPLDAAIDGVTAALGRAGVFDVASVHGRLAELRDTLETAPVQWPSFADRAGAANGAVEPPRTGFIDRMVAELAGLFEFRRLAGTPARPLLRPDEERYLRMNLGLSIEQARVALLARDSTVYAASLAECAALADRYLAADDQRAIDARAELAALTAIDIDEPLPDVRPALEAFERLAPRAATPPPAQIAPPQPVAVPADVAPPAAVTEPSPTAQIAPPPSDAAPATPAQTDAP
jgi:uroporphyrin-3 C-methyltransferase